MFGIIASSYKNAVPGYLPVAINFANSTGSYIYGLNTKGIESKSYTFSCWFKQTTANKFGYLISDNSATNLYVQLNTFEQITFQTYQTNGVLGVKFNTPTNSFVNGQWHHIMFSFDVTSTAKRHVYIDGNPVTTSWTTYQNNNNLRLNRVYVIGAKSTTADTMTGCITEMYSNPGTYIDLSIQSNRDKFYNATTGGPVDLGIDGSLPTGSEPGAYWKGDINNPLKNQTAYSDWTSSAGIANCPDAPV